MRDCFLESATASRQWLIKAAEISNRSDNVSVCLDKTVVANPPADEPGMPWNSLNKTSSGRPCSENS